MGASIKGHAATLQMLLDSNANTNLQTWVCFLNLICMYKQLFLQKMWWNKAVYIALYIFLYVNSMEKQLWDMPVDLDILMLWHY